MTVYQIDKYQHITAFNFKVIPGDYVVIYGRYDPPFTCLAGYAMILDPFTRDLNGWEESSSVGNWEPAVVPHGSDHRSYPEQDNGADWPLPTRLPEEGELDDVYIWHVGFAHEWGIGDQIIVNLKKLKNDFPNNATFRIGIAGATSRPRLGGDGAQLDEPDGYANVPMNLFCGIRAWQAPEGGGGTWDFGTIEEELIDPFGNAVRETEGVARFNGGEFACQFERLTAGGVPGTTGPSAWYLRGWTATLDHKHPKKSVLGGGPINTGPA